MADFVLEADKREVVGKKVKKVRNQGYVPGTIYGPKTDPISVKFPYRPLQVALMNAGGTNLIDVKVNGETYPCLARSVQRDILKGDILHVDFFAVDLEAKIRVEIPLNFVGQSPVVAARQGILLTGPNSITVEMRAARLMDQIEVDLSALTELGDSITIADLNLGDDVNFINAPDEMLAKVVQTSAARAAELEAMEGEGEDDLLMDDEGAEPEVIGSTDEEE